VSVGEIWDKARDMITVERVFGTPFEKDGATFVPVAAVRGGGGGGEGTDDTGKSVGSGSGFGLAARPVGAYVFRDGHVEWQEATDSARIMLGWQIVAVVAVFALRSMFKQRSKTKRRRRS
jgi:uncharacterized spore protein YtfJ